MSSDAVLDLNRLNSSINCSNSDEFTAARVIIGFVGTVDNKRQNTAEMNNQTMVYRRNVGSLIAGAFGKTKQKRQYTRWITRYQFNTLNEFPLI